MNDERLFASLGKVTMLICFRNDIEGAGGKMGANLMVVLGSVELKSVAALHCSEPAT